jgi:hypothetical protein
MLEESSMKRLGKWSQAFSTGRSVVLVLVIFTLAGQALANTTPEFAYVANASSNNVSAYTIDSTTGALTAVSGSPFPAGTNPFSVAITGQSIVPFAAFNVEAAIDLNRMDSFDVVGEFTLGAGSNGINPSTEDVNLQVGTFSTTTPADSFKAGLGQTYAYNGILNGVKLDVAILNIGGGRYLLAAQGIGANLTGTVNPVTVALTIGNNNGSTMVKALIVK